MGYAILLGAIGRQQLARMGIVCACPIRLNTLLRLAIDYVHTQVQIINGTVEQLNEATHSLGEQLHLADADNADKSQQIDRYLETINKLRTENENLALKLKQSTNVLT